MLLIGTSVEGENNQPSASMASEIDSAVLRRASSRPCHSFDSLDRRPRSITGCRHHSSAARSLSEIYSCSLSCTDYYVYSNRNDHAMGLKARSGFLQARPNGQRNLGTFSWGIFLLNMPLPNVWGLCPVKSCF